MTPQEITNFLFGIKKIPIYGLLFLENLVYFHRLLQNSIDEYMMKTPKIFLMIYLQIELIIKKSLIQFGVISLRPINYGTNKNSF